jgi:hypothetical protein
MNQPASSVRPPAVRKEALLGELLTTVDRLKARRAGEIDDAYIDAYVALNWLEWNGGTLRLTVTGDNMRKQLTAGLA